MREAVRAYLNHIRLNRKIQITFIGIIIPLIVLFIVLSTIIYSTNQKYDRVITNSTEASGFSITFKEDFDYKVYRLVAYGETESIVDDIYSEIALSREIVSHLVDNTTIENNRWRAERILKMLDNLEDYVERIRANKRDGGYYDENYSIWENDIQIVTSLIQTTMAEYTYYETKGINEVRETIYQELNRVIFFSLILFAVLTVVAIMLSVIIPNSIVKPIYHLNDITNQVAMGDLDVRANPLNGKEVRQLGQSLNGMIEEINGLVEGTKQNERRLRETELALLQAQINPHFLYNTLDTIVWLAESGDQEAVVSMVTTLSVFFRASLGCGNDVIPLGDEVKHVESYLKIQQVRYADIMTYEIDFDQALAQVAIPKITIQPLVENALYHGIKHIRGIGHIVVSVKQVGNQVRITVSDNGIGIEKEALKAIRKSLSDHQHIGESRSNQHFGLHNVNERIQLKYSEPYGLTIESQVGQGTKVSMLIPMT